MSGRSVFRVVTLLFAMLIGISAHGAEGKWVGTWATAPEGSGIIGGPPPAAELLLGNTLRQVVNASVGGDKVRVRLSNVDGTSPLTILGAHVALQASGSDIVPESDTSLSFGGAEWVTIQPGASVWSDPASLVVPGLARVAVSIYVPVAENAPDLPVTRNTYGLQATYTALGDQTDAEMLVAPEPAQEIVYWLTGIDVYAHKDTQVMVFLGDSLTDGFDVFRAGAKNPFPYELALRLAGAPGANPNANRQWGLLNVGISGNQVSQSTLSPGALVRFDRDVLGQSGVTHVFIWEGINDIGIPGGFGTPPISSQEIKDALSQLATRSRAAGLKVIGATLTPFNGFNLVGGYYSAAGDAMRRDVNDWIRTSGVFDLVVDFDAAVRDPNDDTFMLESLKSSPTLDGLHFNPAGYRALGEAIPLKDLTTSRTLKNK